MIFGWEIPLTIRCVLHGEVIQARGARISVEIPVSLFPHAGNVASLAPPQCNERLRNAEQPRQFVVGTRNRRENAMPDSPEQVCADPGDTQTIPTFCRSDLGAGKGAHAHMDSGESPLSTRMNSEAIFAQAEIDGKPGPLHISPQPSGTS